MFPVYLDNYITSWISDVHKTWPKLNKVCTMDMSNIQLPGPSKRPVVVEDVAHDREWVFPSSDAMIRAIEASAHENVNAESDDDVLVLSSKPSTQVKIEGKKRKSM